MDAIEFFQAIENGAEYRVADIPRLLEDEYDQNNARMMFADFVCASGKSYLLQPDPASPLGDAYNPRQPRDWRGRWTSTGGYSPGERLARAERGLVKALRATPLDPAAVAKLSGERDAAKVEVEGLIAKREAVRAESAALVEKMVASGYTTELNREIARLELEAETLRKEAGIPHPNSAAYGSKPWNMSHEEQKAVLDELSDFDALNREYEATGQAARDAFKSGPDKKPDYVELDRISNWDQRINNKAELLLQPDIEGKSVAELEEIRSYMEKQDGMLYDRLERKVQDRLFHVKSRLAKEEAAKIVAGDIDERIKQIEAMGLRDKTPAVNDDVMQFVDLQVEGYGALPEDQQEEFIRDIKGADVAVAFSRHKLESIIESDGFHNQHVAGDSNGLFDPESRSYFEAALWPDLESVDEENYPVYGFLTGPNGKTLERQHDSVSQYGDLVAIMKPEVDERTTVTIGDSLNNNNWWADGTAPTPDTANVEDVCVPFPKLNPNPNAAAMVASDLGFLPTPMNHDRMSAGFEYPEAQIHGRPKLSDIREIRIPGWKAAAIREAWDDPTKGNLIRLQQLGVPVMVPTDEGGWIPLDLGSVEVQLELGLDDPNEDY